MAGISPEKQAENWRAVRALGRRWMIGVCLSVALAMYAVGYARGTWNAYLGACPTPATPARPPG